MRLLVLNLGLVMSLAVPLERLDAAHLLAEASGNRHAVLARNESPVSDQTSVGSSQPSSLAAFILVVGVSAAGAALIFARALRRRSAQRPSTSSWGHWD